MTTDRLERMTDDELTKILTYAGYVLLSFELVKGMIVDPIKLFYNKPPLTVGHLNLMTMTY